jgi:hypothetical protein
MSVGVMEDYKLRDLRASHTLGWLFLLFLSFSNVFFYPFFLPSSEQKKPQQTTQWEARCAWRDWKLCLDTEI